MSASGSVPESPAMGHATSPAMPRSSSTSAGDSSSQSYGTGVIFTDAQMEILRRDMYLQELVMKVKR